MDKRDAELFTTDQLISDGFIRAIDHYRGGLVSSCDPNTEYDWMRTHWSSSSRFKLSDQSPLMNINGLFFRPIQRGSE